jgi:hypothetical protein
MFRGLRHGIVLVVLSAALACMSTASQASADSAGTVHFVRTAESGFAPFTDNPPALTQAWMRTNFWRMIVWSPYFDERTSWYHEGWVYDDSYAIYPDSALVSQHPEWILKDAAGNDLYIPYACSGGTCPQYAGDISNPEFRHYWIEEARARLAHGYHGLFVDDVDMEERVGNGEGQQVAPIDPHTGQPISASAWRAYMAEFMAEIRAAFPSTEIVHNVIWFSDSDAGTAEPSIRKEIESANYIFLERGANEPGLTGGSGPWSLNTLLSYVDEIHALGRGVILDGTSSEPQGIEFNLASYFLISTGNDAVSSADQTPENWWPGFNVNLGEATDTRYVWENLLRRDFTGGMVLVNPPGSPTRTVSLLSAMKEVSGATVTSVTLPANSGVVLTGNVPLPTPTAGGPSLPVTTETTLQTTVIGSSPSGAADDARDQGAPGSGTAPGRGTQVESVAPSKRPRSQKRSHYPHRRARSTDQGARVASRRPRQPARRRAAMTRIEGVVLHATRGTVAIKIDIRRHARWITVRHLTLSVSATGHFARLLHLQPVDLYRVLAIYTGTSSYRPSRSGYRILIMHNR